MPWRYVGFLSWLLGWEDADGDRDQPRGRHVDKVRKSVLRLIAECGKDAYPNEFSGLLRAQGDTITEMLLSPPGSIGGSEHAIIRFENLGVDGSLIGTVHTHPGPEAFPSNADRELFGSFGNTHIIMAQPYDLQSWRAYDSTGAPVELEIVDD